MEHSQSVRGLACGPGRTAETQPSRQPWTFADAELFLQLQLQLHTAYCKGYLIINISLVTTVCSSCRVSRLHFYHQNGVLNA